MEVLKDKQTRDYNSLSRYSSFPFYYHTKDNKYVYGITAHLNKEIEYVAHKVSDTDNLDALALKYYGRPDYYWIIADFNNIQDPYIKLSNYFEIINIPSLSFISFNLNQGD